MSQIICFLLLVVAVSLSNVSAVTDEEKAAFGEAIVPIITQCSSEHGVSHEDLMSAKEAKNADNINTCFIGCLMRKVEILDNNGFYNPEKGLVKLKSFVKNDEDFTKFEAVAKKCSKVNDEPVTDGDAGCDRAKLLVACVMEYKEELPK